MQSVQSRSQEKTLSAELEDESRVLSSIIQAHFDTCEFTREKIAPLLQKARSEPVYLNCSSTLACPLNPVSHTLDQNRKAEFVEDFSERFSPAIRGVVEFAKRIPGFSILPQDDQVTLLKAGVFEVLLVRLACMFDSQTHTMLSLTGELLKRDSLHHTPNARFLMDSMFDFAERLNQLRLTDAELALFSAVVIVTPDRPGLRNISLVERMAEKLSVGLRSVLTRTRPEQPMIFQNLLKKIPDLRTLNTLHSEKLLAFKMTGTKGDEGPTSAMSYYESASIGPQSDRMHPADPRTDSVHCTKVEDEDIHISDEGVKSPLGSMCSNESICSSELMQHRASVERERPGPLGPVTVGAGGSCVDDDQHSPSPSSSYGCSSSSAAGSLYLRRKLDSPTDSGIESGCEKGKLSPSHQSSVCSSPRSIVASHEEEDMPVLKRALQAPPLINTNLLMDEAYRPHKKFRAMRRECEPESSTHTVSPGSPPQSQTVPPSSPVPAIATASSLLTMRSPLPPATSVSSHSPLTRSLMEAPKLTADQIKHHDYLSAIIMRGGDYQAPAVSPYPPIPSTSASYPGSPTSAKYCPGASPLPRPSSTEVRGDSQPLNLSTKTSSTPPLVSLKAEA
ncbi:unnamed protein product [Cyprideis torosa]|uniref:Uncharacterized protein n=1 Tax=Cyprideis torosa TaxID=163714 RepID=A0A7R8W613_9CRUS|nr:unnamed protein product [Cyprideis torosa]CAG0883526.1 unnamed protein product [Cyprideis torosa]